MRFILIQVLFLIALSSSAQSEAFRNYSNNNGLPGNSVYAVQQDSRGFIWLSTERGVSRFDGVYFQNFSTENGLADNEIFRIYEDRSKRIWFIANNGRLSFFYKNRMFNENDVPLLKSVKPKGMGVEMSEDKNGNLWYLSSTAIYKYSVSGELDSVIFKESDNKRFLAIIHNRDESIFFTGTGIFSWEQKNFFHQKEISKLKLVPNSKVAITDHFIYFSMYEKLIRTPRDKKLWKPDTVCSFEGNIQALQYFNNELWVSTSHGAYMVGLSPVEKKISILEGESVSWILTDRENILWASTLGSGVFMSANPQIKKYDKSNGLAQNAVFRLAFLPDGRMLAGHENFMSSLISGNSVLPVDASANDYRRGRIYSILVENEKSVWLISEKLIHLSINGSRIHIDYIKCSSKDMVRGLKPGQYYVAGSRGLILLNLNKYQKTGQDRSAGLHKFTRGIRLSSLCFNKKRNKLYLGGNSGLFSFDPVTEEFERITFSGQEFRKPVTRIISYNDNFMAFTTAMNGVYLFSEDSIVHITRETGLKSNICNSLCIDSLGNIWVATSRGVNKIMLGDNGINVVSYSEENGMFSSEYYDIITRGENIYAASSDGICIFREDQLRKNNIPPLLLIDEFNVSGTRLDPRKKNVLRSDQNHIRFSFTTLSFRSKGIVYKYKLEGIDKEWKKTSLSEVEYAYLPPGKYKFFLTATNLDGIQTDLLNSEFEIRRSFYSSAWFYTILAVGVLFLLSALIYSWFRRVNEKHRVKQITLQVERDHAENEKKMIELEHMALRLHMNPHFVFNAINTIQGFYAANDILKAKSYISKFSRLIRSIMDTSREQRVPLADEIDLLRNYLELCALRMEHPFSYEITWENNLNPSECEISPMLVQPFVENAILHGISPLKGGGHVIIRFSKRDNYLECIVEDNGIGRERSAKLSIGKFHKSSGIKVTQERISLINKGAFIDSNIDIIDLFDEKNLPAGTRIKFRMPLYQEDQEE